MGIRAHLVFVVMWSMLLGIHLHTKNWPWAFFCMAFLAMRLPAVWSVAEDADTEKWLKEEIKKNEKSN